MPTTTSWRQPNQRGYRGRLTSSPASLTGAAYGKTRQRRLSRYAIHATHQVGWRRRTIHNVQCGRIQCFGSARGGGWNDQSDDCPLSLTTGKKMVAVVLLFWCSNKMNYKGDIKSCRYIISMTTISPVIQFKQQE